MVAAVDFFATREDEKALLNYLGEPGAVTLHPWPICPLRLPALDRRTLESHAVVMVASSALGAPRLVNADDASMRGGSRAAVFNRINWERLEPAPDEGLVDSNASPVLVRSSERCDDVGG
jgi:hypothetical protein